jgi:osmotically-inducible protein OsmY
MRKHSLRGAAFTAAVAVLLMGAPALSADDADDAVILRDIEARFEKENVAQDAQVEVTVSDGEVTLTGIATHLPASRLAEKLARDESSVVHNRIRVVIEEPVKDADIVEGIRSAILGYPRYEIFDYVEFGVTDGNVLLQGSVIHPWKKADIESRVARVVGIKAIENNIGVQSFSRFDSDLRRSLARRIYGDPRFVQYGARSHPPIRILVDRGHVTLAGWVSSPVEKAVLGNIALSSPSFGVTNELNVDTDVPAEDRKEGETSSS